MSKIRFIARKELYHILRDPRSLTIVLAMPILMTFLYGYAINMVIENIVIGIVDYDKSAESRDFADRFKGSTYFSEPETSIDPADPESAFRTDEANAVLIIHSGFGQAMAEHEEFSIGLLIDGSDNNVAAAVQNYANVLLFDYLRDQMPPDQELPGVRLAVQVLYNPDLKSALFFVPGLVAIILMMVSALLTSITIAREKETGTLEQLLTAPVNPAQIVIGKIIPYVFIAILDGVLVLAFARILFGLPFEGSMVLLLALGMIYVTAALSMGLLISSIVKTQQVAMMFAIVSTVLPSVLLSGFIFAIKNFPLPLEMLSHVVAARYFLVIIRGILLKAAPFDVLAVQGGYLVLLTLVMLTIAARKFSTRVG